ncbi:MAG: Ku protein [Deltaproteobacteria bacterium]|nr:MAG: Ku protein [Deltaproteobacteria bacterium]
MPRRKKMDTEPTPSAERSFWRGALSFGLVQIPIGLYRAERADSLHFRMINRCDMAPIRMERVSSKTGKPVDYKDVVKGYDLGDGDFILLTDDELKQANVGHSENIDILQFVHADEIDPMLYETPYYVAPQRQGIKAYVLLREALRHSGQVGVAKVVLRTRQHLAVLRVDKDALILHLLRFAHDLRDPKELHLPPVDKGGLNKKEMQMASKLIESMAERFAPQSHHDTYREDVLALIDKKKRAGATQEVAVAPKQKTPSHAKVVDMMDLLAQSVKGRSARTRKGPISVDRKRSARRKGGAGAG